MGEFGFHPADPESYTSTGLGANFALGSRFPLTEAGTVTKISVYVGDYAYGSGNSKCAIFDVDGLGHPINLKGTSETKGSLTVDSWNDFACNIPLLAGDYFLIVWSEQNPQWWYDTGETEQWLQTQSGQAMNGFPTPWEWLVFYLNRKMCIYAEYTPSVGGLSIPVAMHHYSQMTKIRRG